jgi:endonuclease/exonuclease/phosphatase family metal-dependent hydrolase
MSDLVATALQYKDKPVPGDNTTGDPGQRIRLLSYNIQTGIRTTRYSHYVTQSWKHVLPHAQRFRNLDRVASQIRDYDIVGLQEVDAGSLRSGYVNLTQYLGEKAQFPFWYDQTNRSLGRFARNSTGLLSRFSPTEITEHRLPGRIPGRGALLIRYGTRLDCLVVLILHLALGRRARLRQLGYVSELINEYRHVVMMGDLNCHSQSVEMNFLINRTMMQEPYHGLHTFPSWCPQRNIDHILVTPTLQVDRIKVLAYSLSDHLPVSMDITLPESIHLAG